MKIQRIKNLIHTLKSLDLSTYPKERIITSLKEFQDGIPTVVATLEPGRIIVRGTPYEEKFDFSMISRLSYKPQQINKTYQRASTPYATMFYGSLTSEIKTEPCARMSILTEIGKTYKEGAEKETLMFSSWEVIEPIRLVAAIQNNSYPEPCQKVIHLQKQYKEIFKEIPGREFMNYIASEFAKEDANEKEDFKYMISAWFTKMVCDKSYDGVAYPSVRIGGAGINVAIKPQAVDSKLKLLYSSECEVTNINKKISIQIKTISFIKEDGTLGYRPITEDDYKTII